MKNSEFARNVLRYIEANLPANLEDIEPNERVYFKVFINSLITVCQQEKDNNKDEVQCASKNAFYKFLLDTNDLLQLFIAKGFINPDDHTVKLRDQIYNHLVKEMYRVTRMVTVLPNKITSIEAAIFSRPREDVRLNAIPLMDMHLIADCIIDTLTNAQPDDQEKLSALQYYASKHTIEELVRFLHKNFLQAQGPIPITRTELGKINIHLRKYWESVGTTVVDVFTAPYTKANKMIITTAKYLFAADIAAKFDLYSNEESLLRYSYTPDNDQAAKSKLKEYIVASDAYKELQFDFRTQETNNTLTVFDPNKIPLTQDAHKNRLILFKAIRDFRAERKENPILGGYLNFLPMVHKDKTPATEWLENYVLDKNNLTNVMTDAPKDFRPLLSDGGLGLLVKKIIEAGSIQSKPEFTMRATR